MPIIHFNGADGSTYRIDAPEGISVMEAALDNGVPGIDADCGGAGICATCHCYVDPAWAGRTGEASEDEADMLDGLACRTPFSRLSCQLVVTPGRDGLIVSIPESQE